MELILTKTQQAVDLWNDGKKLEALRLFKGFKLGMTKEEKDAIVVYFEMLTGKQIFYESLGFNMSEVKEKAEAIINQKFIQ